MDIRTTILALAAGNVIFGIMLLLYEAREHKIPSNPAWTAGKFLQGGAWLLFFFRGTFPDFFTTFVANSCLISGFAYECWAMHQLSSKEVTTTRITGSLVITILVCFIMYLLPSPAHKITLASWLSTVFFALAGRALLTFSGPCSLLRRSIGWSYLVLAGIVFGRGTLALDTAQGFALFSANAIQFATFSALYYLMLTGGFGILLLTREKTDRELTALLKEEHAILATLPTGLCILRDRVIERCNPAMEEMFGYPPGGLLGKSTRVLYENDEIFQRYGVKIYQDIDEKGKFSGEMPYIRQNGEKFWAFENGTTIFPERSRAWAVFSITDISAQKRQQDQLRQQKEELEKTLARIKRLEGIISICMYCKKIRNEQQSWEQLEKYISQNTDAKFSHGICPECYKKRHGSLPAISTNL